MGTGSEGSSSNTPILLTPNTLIHLLDVLRHLMCRQRLSATSQPHVRQLIMQLLRSEGVGGAFTMPPAATSAGGLSGWSHFTAPGAASEGGTAADTGEALRERWATTLLSLAEAAAAYLSPSLCTGSGGVMDPRYYIKVL